MKDDIGNRLMDIRGRIAEACEEHDRDADDITILAVTKRFPASVIQTVVAAGMLDIGESRVQEAEEKIKALGSIARYHLIGHLQGNKAKKAVELFDVIQSVDSFKLAKEINRHAEAAERRIECLIQINASGEKSKYGVAPEKALELVGRVNELAAIDVTGLMTIGPLTDDEERIREAFAHCHELFQEGEKLVGETFDTLSMGMTDDFPLAIAEGSTMIRIGTAIFGPRPA